MHGAFTQRLKPHAGHFLNSEQLQLCEDRRLSGVNLWGQICKPWRKVACERLYTPQGVEMDIEMDVWTVKAQWPGKVLVKSAQQSSEPGCGLKTVTSPFFFKTVCSCYDTSNFGCNFSRTVRVKIFSEVWLHQWFSGTINVSTAALICHLWER